MIKGKQLLGLQIIGQNDGKHLGAVHDLIFDHDSDELLALVLAEKDLFGLIDAQVVLWKSVLKVGNDAILVESAAARIALRSEARLSDVATRETALSGTKVLAQDGANLGTLADMCVDETTGQVLGYEVSKGFLADTLRGKKFLPSPPGIAIGKDAAIVSPAGEAALKKQ